MRYLLLAVLAVSCSNTAQPLERHGRAFSAARQAMVAEALAQPVSSYVRRSGDTMSGTLKVPQLISTGKVCVDASCTRYVWKDGSNNLGLVAGIGNNIAADTGIFDSAANGTNAFAVVTNGARVDFGAGANDYVYSDGSEIITPSQLWVSSGNGVYLDTGGTRRIYDNGANILVNTSFGASGYTQTSTVGTPASGTGITANYSGAVRNFVHKVTVINTALAAAATSDVTLAVTPVNTRITRVTADVTQVFTGGVLSAMTVTCGNAAGGNQYLLSGSVFAAQTTLGDVVAEMGAGVVSATLADFGTVAAGVPGAITVQCRFTCTGANCSAATQGSVTFYVEGTTY